MESWRWFLTREFSYGAELVRKREEKRRWWKSTRRDSQWGHIMHCAGQSSAQSGLQRCGLLFLFVMDFSKNRNYSIIPLPNQIWPLRHRSCKKYQSLSNSSEMLWWLVLVKPWLHLIGCRVPRWNIFNPDFWVCLWGCFQMRLARGKQTAFPMQRSIIHPGEGPSKNKRRKEEEFAPFWLPAGLLEWGHLIFSGFGLKLNSITGFPGPQPEESRSWAFSASVIRQANVS